MTTIPFEQPHINWDSTDLYQGFSRFRNQASSCFASPLSKQSAKEKAGWLGTWI